MATRPEALGLSVEVLCLLEFPKYLPSCELSELSASPENQRKIHGLLQTSEVHPGLQHRRILGTERGLADTVTEQTLKSHSRCLLALIGSYVQRLGLHSSFPNRANSMMNEEKGTLRNMPQSPFSFTCWQSASVCSKQRFLSQLKLRHCTACLRVA